MQTSSASTTNEPVLQNFDFNPPAHSEAGNLAIAQDASSSVDLFLSIVVPIYNDGKEAERFCLELERVLKEYLNTENLEDLIEVLFIDDGSRNDSVLRLCELTPRFKWAKVIQLSRNFGQHIAQSCGYSYATGRYVATINVDMQDPPYELPKLLDRIQKEDMDYVRGVRKERKDPLMQRFSSSAFLYFFGMMTGIKIPRMPSSMRVMSRLYIDAFNTYTEKVRFALGLEYWLGFKCGFVEIDHVERRVGKSSYNFGKRMSLALDAIVSFSDIPLKMGIYGGCAMATLGLLLGVWYALQKLILPEVLPGFTSIVIILLFSQGTILTILGIMGLYIGRILKEVQNRPLFIVRNTHNFSRK